ncbi:MAG: hypothetical protein AABW54_01290 [Candidatus Micrarchaeota archaeon]
MEIFSNLAKTLEESVAWAKEPRDGKTLQAAGIMAVMQIILLVGAAVLILQTGGSLPQAYLQAAAGGTGILTFLAVALVVLVVFIIIQGYLQLLMLCRALVKIRGKKCDAHPLEFAHAIAMVIAIALYAIFSWPDRRLLAIPAVALLLLAFSGMMPIAAMISIILLAAYYVIIVRNATRLSMALPYFAEKGFRGVGAALNYAWQATHGKAFSIFATLAIANAVLAIGAMIITVIGGFIPFIGILVAAIVSSGLAACQAYALVSVYNEAVKA